MRSELDRWDAERTWDVEQAAAEGRDIRSEELRELEAEAEEADRRRRGTPSRGER